MIINEPEFLKGFTVISRIGIVDYSTDPLHNKTSTAIFIFWLQIRKISSAYTIYKPPQFSEFSLQNLKISLIVLLCNRSHEVAKAHKGSLGTNLLKTQRLQ